MAEVRWGNTGKVVRFIKKYPWIPFYLEPFYTDVKGRMPDGFPEYDYEANYATRLKQAKAIWKWYEDNKNRLAWDKEKRRYYLREEEE